MYSSTNELNQADPESVKIKCGSTIRGAAVHKKLLVAWGNNSAEVFDFAAEDGQESGAKLPNAQGPLCIQEDHMCVVLKVSARHR